MLQVKQAGEHGASEMPLPMSSIGGECPEHDNRPYPAACVRSLVRRALMSELGT